MHIAIDARMAGPTHRGIGRYIQRLLEALARRTDSNRYTLFVGPETDRSVLPHGGKFRLFESSARWYSAREHLEMPGLVRASKADLVHWPHFNVPYFCPRPFVVTIHDLIVHHFPETRATTHSPLVYRLKLAGYEIVQKRALARAECIIAVSEFTKRDVVKTYRIPSHRITPILLGADQMVLGTGVLPNSAEFSDYLRRTYGINKPYLLYVGSAYPHKNLHTLAQAFILLRTRNKRDWQLVLVGKQDVFYKRLQEELQHDPSVKQVADDIIFTGQVGERDLDGLYRGARMFVFPSYYEGFGLPPLEAASRGVPVIAAKAASVPEVMGDAAHYFDPHDPETIAQVLDLVGGSSSMRQSLAHAGRERVKLFSWDRMARETVAVYERASVAR